MATQTTSFSATVSHVIYVHSIRAMTTICIPGTRGTAIEAPLKRNIQNINVGHLKEKKKNSVCTYLLVAVHRVVK